MCLMIDACVKYYPERETCTKELEGERKSKEKEARRKKEEDFGDTRLGRLRTWLWNLTEYPETSLGARASKALVTRQEIPTDLTGKVV